MLRWVADLLIGLAGCVKAHTCWSSSAALRAGVIARVLVELKLKHSLSQVTAELIGKCVGQILEC